MKKVDFDIKKMYEQNADFKDFVDAYCKNYTEGKSIPVDVAFTHALVIDYAFYVYKKSI